MKRTFFLLQCMTLALLGLSFAVFAANTDSLGLIGGTIVEAFKTTPLLSPVASVLYAAIVWALVRFTQWLLKKVPTKWGPFGPSVLWKFLSIMFGKSVLFYKGRTTDENLKAKVLLREEFKEHLRKHDPICSIDVK